MHTIRPHVFDVLDEIGEATPEQVHERLPMFTLKQIRTSMWSSCNAGLLAAVVRGKRCNAYRLLVGAPDGGFVAEKADADLFTPNRGDCNVKRPRYASVWNYAQGVTA